MGIKEVIKELERALLIIGKKKKTTI